MEIKKHLITFATSAVTLLSSASAETSLETDTETASELNIEISRDKTHPREPYYVHGTILINAPRERIWELMTNCEATEQIVPQLQNCEIVVEGDGWDQRRHDVRSGPFRISSVFRSDYEPLRSIRITRVSGDMEVQEGSWTLTPQANGQTEISYEAWSKPGFWVPRWFITRSVKRDAPRILANLKNMAESTAG
ncbi:MAG: SRPBCC family protein [Pseudomonadota bacterium]